MHSHLVDMVRVLPLWAQQLHHAHNGHCGRPHARLPAVHIWPSCIMAWRSQCKTCLQVAARGGRLTCARAPASAQKLCKEQIAGNQKPKTTKSNMTTWDCVHNSVYTVCIGTRTCLASLCILRSTHSNVSFCMRVMVAVDKSQAQRRRVLVEWERTPNSKPDTIARRAHVSVKFARRWISKFCVGDLSLSDAPRSGRSRALSAKERSCRSPAFGADSWSHNEVSNSSRQHQA